MPRVSARDAVVSVLGGEPAAFSELVNRYFGSALAVATARVANVQDAQDVVQEAFLRAFQSLHELRRPESFGPWLMTIVRNTSIKLIRRKSREAPLAAALQEASVPAVQPEAREMAQMLHQQILRLDEDKREVLLMHYFAGRSLQEIAETLDISRHAAAKRLQRARDALGERLLSQAVPNEDARYRASPEKTQPIMGLILTVPAPWVSSGPAAISAPRASVSGAKGVTALVKLAGIPVAILTIVAASWVLADKVHPKGSSLSLEGAAHSVAAAQAPSLALPEEGASQDDSNGPGDPASDGSPSVPADGVAPSTAPDSVDLTDAQSVWRRVVEVNRVWLQPQPKALAYTLNKVLVSEAGAEENLQKDPVVVADSRGRWESDDGYALRFAGDTGVYTAPPKLMNDSPLPMRYGQAVRQGVTWQTALHAFADKGLPETIKVTDCRSTAAGQEVVLEGDVSDTRSEVGIGLVSRWFGYRSARIDHIRIHVRVPDFVPILEEDLSRMPEQQNEKWSKIEIGPQFLAFGAQRAPQNLALHATTQGEGQEQEWVIAASFKQVGDAWLLDRASSTIAGKVRSRAWTTNVDDAPAHISETDLPDAQGLVAMAETLKKGWQPAGDTGKPAEPEAPRVVSVYPAHGDSGAPLKTELRIQFDRPMKPDALKVLFARGRFCAFDVPSYDAETYTFSVPVELLPGERTQVIANDKPASRGTSFRSEEGIEAQGFQWTFETAATQVPTDAPQPIVTEVTPASGSTVACLTYVSIAFDCPINPGSLLSMEADSKVIYASCLPILSCGPDANRCVVPLALPPDTEVDLKLGGFTSEQGILAEPIQLHYKTTRVPFDPAQLPKSSPHEEAQLVSLLQRMRTARANVTSLSERVVRVVALRRPFDRGFSGLSSCATTFRVQGSGQFYADISEVMTIPFILGSDGESCWFYYRDEEGAHEKLEIVPFGDVPEKNVAVAASILAPGQDPSEVIAQRHLRYEGVQTVDGKSCDVVRGLSLEVLKDLTTAIEVRWWIDREALLPIRVTHEDQSRTIIMKFQYDDLDVPIPDGAFQIPQIEGLAPTLGEPLKHGHRFVTIMDGSTGKASVRWGRVGPDGLFSDGFN